MGAFDYVFTPKDIARAFRPRHIVGVSAGTAVALGLHYGLKFGLDISLLLATLTTVVIWRLDTRVPFIGAIVCFVLIMIASIFNPSTSTTQGSWSDQFAVIAFYFLVIGVVLLIREHIFGQHADEAAGYVKYKISEASRKLHHQPDLVRPQQQMPHGAVQRTEQTASRPILRPLAPAVDSIRPSTPKAHPKPATAPLVRPHVAPLTYQRKTHYGLDKKGLINGKPIQI